jgi:integrase
MAAVGQEFVIPRGKGVWAYDPAQHHVSSLLPLVADLTPHGLRHGHKTWMAEDGIPEVLQAERMGHAVPGMRGVYTHISDAMRPSCCARFKRGGRRRSRSGQGSPCTLGCRFSTSC